MAVTVSVQASQTALNQSIAAGVAKFNAQYASQNQLNLQINSQGFTRPLGQITGNLREFESALAASNARVLAFGASTAVLGGIVKVFKEISSATIEVEKSLTDINRVLNLGTTSLQKFSTDLFGVAKQTASSFSDASKAALEFSRQGLSTEDTLKRTADALTLVRLTGVSATQAVEDLTATTNAFKDSGLSTTEILNKIVAVEQRFAVSASDLTEAVSRTGQAAREAGVGFDELNALVTSAQEKTARGGAVIGNALKTIFTRIQRKDTLDQLEQFGITVRDLEGNALSATQILKNFATSYDSLAQSTKSALSEQVAGVYQVNILKSIITDINNVQGVYNRSLEYGAKATNEATVANEKLNSTLAAVLAQTQTDLLRLGNNLGKVTFDPLFKSLVKPFDDAIAYINNLLEGEGVGSTFANGLLKGIGNVLGGPGLVAAIAVIGKVISNTFAYATQALPALFNITTETQKRKNIEEAILKIINGQSNASLALQGHQGDLVAQQQILLNLATAQTAKYQEQLALSRQLASTLVKQNVNVGPAGLQIGKVKAAGYIPPATRFAEIAGAKAGGYMPGNIVPSPVGGVMNTAENVRYIPGFAQPFINPPANSKAGMQHRQNSIARTGVDPYMFGGFIPNFANQNIRPQKVILDRVIDGDSLGITFYPAQDPISSSSRLFGWDAPEKNTKEGAFAKQLAEKYFRSDIGKDVTTLFEAGYNMSDKKEKYGRPFFHSQGLINQFTAYDPAIGVPYFGFGKRASSFGGFIPNFAGEMSNAKIAAWLRMGKLTPEQAAEMGYKPSAQKIAEQRGQDFISKIPYQVIPIPFKTFGESGATLQSAYGTEYEQHAISILKGMGYPDVKSAVEFGIPGGGNSRADAIDPVAKAFFEMKGGDITSVAELKSKFSGVRNDLVEKYRRELLTYRDILIRNPNYQRSSSGGFIPNFAYKQAVMSLESGLSGKNAIFDTKPFPHIRNSSQPTFSSAIADHGGLNNALRDSVANQKMAGLMNKGFVPNFAIAPIQSGYDIAGPGIMPGTISISKMLKDAEKNLIAQVNFEIQLYKKGAIDKQILIDRTKDLAKQFNLTEKSEQALVKQLDSQRLSLPTVSRSMSASGSGVLPNLPIGFSNKQPGFFSAGGKLDTFLKSAAGQTVIGTAIPMLAGQAQAMIEGGKPREELSYNRRLASSAISSVSQSASSGAIVGGILGPQGAIVGGAIGAIVGFANAIDGAKLSVTELSAVIAKSSEKIQKNVSGGSEYASAVEAAKTATTQEQKLNAQKTMASALSKINDPALLGQIQQAGANPEKIKKIISDYELGNAPSENIKNISLFGAEGAKTDKKEIARSIANVVASQPELQKEILGYKKETVAKQVYVGGNAPTTFYEETQASKEKRLDIVRSFKRQLSTEDQANEEIIGPLTKVLDEFLQSGNKEAFEDFLKKNDAAKKIIDDMSKDAEKTSTVFSGISSTLQYISRSVEARTSQKMFDDQLVDLQLSFENFLQEGLIDPVEVIKQESIVKAKKLQSQFEITRDKNQVSFYQQFQSNVEKLGVGSGKAQELRDLITSTATTPQDLENYVNSLKTLTVDQRKNLLEEIQNFKFQQSENEKARNFQVNMVGIEESQLTFKARLQKAEAVLANQQKDLLNQRERLLSKEQTAIETAQFAREARLNYAPTFYGTTLKQETEMRISAREKTTQENLGLFRQGQMNTVQAAYEAAYSQRAEDKARSRGEVFDPTKIKYAKIKETDLESEIAANKKLLSSTEINTKQHEKLKTYVEALENAQSKITLETEKQIKNGKVQAELDRQRAADAASFRMGMEDATHEMQRSIDSFPSTLGKTTTIAFRDGLVGAMDAAINKTDDLKTALLEVASGFLKTIQNAMFQNVANQMTVQLFGKKQSGGLIRAQNGMYISGGRTGDKNPALLEDGEYVLNREAVKSLGGPKFLDNLNFNRFPRFGGYAQGGSPGDFQSGVALGKPFSNLSEFGKENSPEYQNYLSDLRAKYEADQAKRAKRKALIRGIVMSAVSIAAMSAMKYAGSGTGSSSYPREGPSEGIGIDPESGELMKQRGGLMRFASGGYLPYGNRLNDTIPAMLSGGEYIVNSSAVRRYGVGGLNRINSGIAGFQDGGLVGGSLANSTSSSSSNVSVNITVNASEGKSGNTQQSSSGDLSSKDQGVALGNKIKEVVLQVITNEQRTGGILDSTKKK